MAVDSSLVEKFLAWAQYDRNRSPHTLERYKSVLRDLSKFADPGTATLEDVETWWQSRFHMSASSRANELACLRSFYKWATRFDHREEDPTRRLDAPQVHDLVPRMIGRVDFDRLLGELTEDTPDLRRVFALGGYAGLRVSECATLDWKNVDLEARRMYVTGKGGKERPVPMSPVLVDYLLPDAGGNVVTAGGKAYTPGTLQRKVNRLMERHGIKHTFHDLRKRGASLALSKGASHAAVKTMFGWSSFETVAHYAVVGDDELDKIAEMLL